MGIIVAALFILLLLCFYFIALLNMKINRFQNNERKNEIIFEEMEASISSFLTDIEDENARLIQSLQKVQAVQQPKESTDRTPVVKNEVKRVEVVEEQSIVAELMEQTLEKEMVIELVQEQVNTVEQHKSTNLIETPIEEVAPITEPITYSAPKAYVKNAYKTQKKEKPVQTVEERVYDMYARGQTIGAIAKELGKGKVEVELLLKFNNKNT